MARLSPSVRYGLAGATISLVVFGWMAYLSINAWTLAKQNRALIREVSDLNSERTLVVTRIALNSCFSLKSLELKANFRGRYFLHVLSPQQRGSLGFRYYRTHPEEVSTLIRASEPVHVEQC